MTRFYGRWITLSQRGSCRPREFKWAPVLLDWLGAGDWFSALQVSPASVRSALRLNSNTLRLVQNPILFVGVRPQ